MKIRKALVCGPVLISLVVGVSAQDSDGVTILAEGAGISVSRDLVETEAAEKLRELDLERLRFEAGQTRKRHQIIDSTLQELIAERLFALESENRDISKEQLLAAEVDEKVPEPTQEEIDKFFETNRRRLQGDKEKLLPQISRYLKRQKARGVRQEFVDGLAEKYGVSNYLEPLRFDIAVDGFPSLGPDSAPVTIVEFSDFQCPYCAKIGPTLVSLQKEYGDQVRLVFRQFPLSTIHPQAQKAAEAALCAGEQGKFWEMHDSMFGNVKKLSSVHLKEQALTIGLDAERFTQCLESDKYRETVKADIQAGMSAGVTGTPAMFINGRPLSGAVPYETLAKTVEEELAASMEGR
jgi:protein-disulfide isomerase